MVFASARSQIARTFLGLLLSPVWLRRRIAFHLRQYYFEDLEIAIPIGNNLLCPITRYDHVHSLAETFIGPEYASLIDTMPLPDRWIDIGCHAGYFSLFIAMRHRKKDPAHQFKALLVDADPRTEFAVNTLIKNNGLEDAFIYKHAAISIGTGQRDFAPQQAMSSCVKELSASRVPVVPVQIIDEAAILAAIKTPYDLIKVDIEGSEYDLLTAYQKLIRSTPYLLLEWHSWHSGGGGLGQILDLAASLGFAAVPGSTTSYSINFDGKDAQYGIILFKRIDK